MILELLREIRVNRTYSSHGCRGSSPSYSSMALMRFLINLKKKQEEDNQELDLTMNKAMNVSFSHKRPGTLL